MLTNIKYSFLSLIRNTKTTILSIIQMSICFVFLYFLINQSLITLTEMKKISSVLDNKKMYSFEFIDEVNILNNKENSKKIKYFHEIIKNKYDENISFYSDENLQVKNFDGINKFTSPGGSNEDFSWVRAINIDLNFVNNFEFKIDVGRYFSKEDFKSSNSLNTPIILGSEYKKFFNLGDIIEYKNQYGGDIRKLKIVGFLEKNSIFISDENTINLDSYVIFSLKDINNTISLDSNNQEYDNMVNFLQIRLFREILIQSEENSDIIDDINLMIKENSLSNLIYIKDLSESKINIINEFKSSVLDQIIGVSLSFILVTLGLIFNSLNKIKLQYKEIGIHISYGCSIENIFLRILLEFIFLSLISFISCIIFIISYRLFGSKEIEYLINYKTLLIILIISLFWGVIISLPSAIKIKSMEITNLVRR